MTIKKRKMSGKSAQGNTKKKWLIMVYMEAGDNSNLDALAVQDLIELQAGVQGTKEPRIAGNRNVVAVVQMKRRWPDVPQRYFIGPGKSVVTLGAAEDKDMATQKSLTDFLTAAKKIGVKNKVTHRCLVLWGHNFGLAFGRDRGDPLKITELAGALKEHGQGKKWLNVLATNSCTMAYIEAAFQIRDSVEYLAASQVFMPPTGFPYTSIVRNIGADTEPERLGEIIVDEYVNSFATSRNGEKVAMSLLNLDREGTNTFKDLLRETAAQIKAVIGRGGKTVVQQALQEMQDVFLANPAGDVRPVLDLQRLGRDLRDYCDDCLTDMNPVQEAGSARDFTPTAKSDNHFRRLLTKLRGSGESLHNALGNGGPATKGDTRQFVLKNGKSPDLGPLGGVGVFAPFVVDDATRKQLELASKADRKLYRDLAIFAEHKDWPNLVYDTLSRQDPDEIVNAAGVVQPADRVQVNQLVGAVNAAFNTLDRVLRSSKPRLLNILGVKPTEGNGESSGLAPFGPPRLKLAGDLTLQSPRKGEPLARVPEEIVSILERVERAVGLVETTVKRVVTNGSFGLGPSKSVGLGPKSAGFGPKSAGFGPKSAGFGPKSAGFGPKSAGFGPKSAGFGPKSAGFGSDELPSDVDALTAFLPSDAQVAMLSVSAMFRTLATDLANLEQTVADIESAAADCQLQHDFGSVLNDDQYRAALEQRLDRLFAVASEAGQQARRTARAVMAHPIYGLGIGPEDFGQPERDELAIAAGLSQSQLALL
jgi:Clostripain family